MKDSRHVEILQELDRKSVVSVKELKELFGVTDMTIRRDLIDLEKQGLLVRVHGGAHKKVKDSLLEASHSEKNLINIDEKRSIAKKCADLIENGDTVFIDLVQQQTLSEIIWKEKKLASSLIPCLFLRSSRISQIMT